MESKILGRERASWITDQTRVEDIRRMMKSNRWTRAFHIMRRTNNTQSQKSCNPDIVEVRADREPGGEIKEEPLWSGMEYANTDREKEVEDAGKDLVCDSE